MIFSHNFLGISLIEIISDSSNISKFSSTSSFSLKFLIISSYIASSSSSVKSVSPDVSTSSISDSSLVKLDNGVSTSNASVSSITSDSSPISPIVISSPEISASAVSTSNASVSSMTSDSSPISPIVISSPEILASDVSSSSAVISLVSFFTVLVSGKYTE